MIFTEENIRDYVQDVASDELRTQIDKAIESDPELKMHIDLQRLANKAVHLSILKNKLDKAQGRFIDSENQKKANLSPKTTPRILSLRPLLSLAAILILAAVLSIVIIRSYQSPMPYEAYLSGDPGLPTLMGDHTDSLQSAMVDYKSGKLAQAEIILNELKNTHRSDDTYAYYLANIDLKRKEFDKAYTAFSLLLASSKYKIHAQWYITLLDLKNGKKSAIDELHKIAADPNNVYARDAAKLLDEME